MIQKFEQLSASKSTPPAGQNRGLNSGENSAYVERLRLNNAVR
jgi:hypothetical protein